jgi:hypothetical protein
VKERSLTPRQAAVCLVAVLERRGARFHLKADGYFLCDLNPSDVASSEEAEWLSRAVLALRDEIRLLLHDDRTVH